ncbi:MAG: cpaB [Devosia sp.]|nr:cpaB [Devosia sp.]
MAKSLQSSADAPTGAEYPNDEGIERRRHPRYRMDIPDEMPVQVSPQVERRQHERRNIDEMRAELQRAYVAPINPGKRDGWFGRSGVKPKRIVLLLVALLAGGMAAYLTIAGSRTAVAEAPVETVREVVREARVRILVARTAIGIGQQLLPASIGWEEWPEEAILGDYITAQAAPGAAENLSHAVARFAFFPGDPIREQKLVRDAQGYLSAVLEPGMRGVSVSVSALTGSGGFISPNDHVDVLLTRNSPGAEASETVLRNVRVLAIDSRLGETGSTGSDQEQQSERVPTFSEAIATLELDETGAQVIVGASAMGKLTLVLRAMSDFGEAQSTQDLRANQAIRLTSPFWASAGSTPTH